MKPKTDKPARAGRVDERDDSHLATPAADMQPEDAHAETPAPRGAARAAAGSPSRKAEKKPGGKPVGKPGSGRAH